MHWMHNEVTFVKKSINIRIPIFKKGNVIYDMCAKIFPYTFEFLVNEKITIIFYLIYIFYLSYCNDLDISQVTQVVCGPKD